MTTQTDPSQPDTSAGNALNDQQLDNASGGRGMPPPKRVPDPFEGRTPLPPGQPYTGDLDGTIQVNL
jgi:hypothetical protein